MTTNETLVMTTRPAGAGLRRFGLVCQTHLVLFLRNRTALFFIIAFPIGLMLLFGAIYGQQPQSISFLVSGMIVLSLMSNGIIGNATTMATWRERGILRRIQTTPLPVWQLLLSRIVVQAGIMVVQAGLLLCTSVLVFNAHFEIGNILAAIPSIVGGALLFMAIGQMIAALVSKVETINVISQVIYFPLMFLGNIMISANVMPAFLQAIGKVLPSTMIADLVRIPLLGLSAGAPVFPLTLLPFSLDLIGVAAYFVVALAIATRFFKWN